MYAVSSKLKPAQGKPLNKLLLEAQMLAQELGLFSPATWDITWAMEVKHGKGLTGSYSKMKTLMKAVSPGFNYFVACKGLTCRMPPMVHGPHGCHTSIFTGSAMPETSHIGNG